MKFAGQRVVLKLVLAHIAAHPGRLVFTLLSTIVSAAIVVWIVSGYDSLVNKFDDFAEGYLGRYELIVLPARKANQFGGMGPPSGNQGVASAVIERLQKDPDVAVVEPALQLRARIVNPNAPPEERPEGQRGSRTRTKGGNPPAPRAAAPGEEAPPPANPTPAQSAQMMARFARTPVLVGTDASEPPHALASGRWIDPAKREPIEGVMTSASAEQLKVKVGDEVVVSPGMGGEGNETRVKVVGIAEQPKTLPPPKFMIGLPPTRDAALRGGPASSALYVGRQVVMDLNPQSKQASYAGIHLKTGVNPATVQERWGAELAALEPSVEIQSLANVESEISGSTTAEVVRTQALSATGIALLAALFIIYTTLSMGVSERIRQFAVLRAVALTKAHITGIILTESIALGLIGWLGGLLAGWGLLSVMRWYSPASSADSAALGSWCIILSGCCAVGGSLAAAIMPAWQATRVSPLDAMGPRRGIAGRRLSSWMTAVGLLLICLNPLVVFYIPMADTARYMWSAAIGCTAMTLGFVLLTPLTVMLCERFFGRFIAAVLRLPPGLLATQLTSNLWRTVGTSVSLTLGLGLFVAMQTWGYSMLGPFTPGTWVPDMLVIMGPTGVPDSEIEAVRNAPGVKSDQFAALATKHVKFADDVTGFEVRASATRQDTCVMVGVDPAKSIGGNQPLFSFEFVAGSREEAAAKLARGHFCLVPDHFARESGLSVGDKFSVIVPAKTAPGERGSRRRRGAGRSANAAPAEGEVAKPEVDRSEAPKSDVAQSDPEKAKSDQAEHAAPVGSVGPAGPAAAGPASAPPMEQRIEYEIAGVVSMPGWHWMTKQGFRQGRAAGLMFADFDQVRRDFAIDRTTLFWMNLDQGVDEDDLQKSMQAIAARSADPNAPAGAAEGASPRGFGRRATGPTASLKSADSVRTAITARADGIIWVLSQLPLVTLAVTSVSVINTVLASIRARRWELGVLRALGITRLALVRLIVAEALLVGVVACVLSLGFGVMAGYCGTGVTRYINIRGGMVTPLIIPWAKIAVGFACALGLCLLAAVWPALSTARSEPLRLLQAGRASM